MQVTLRKAADLARAAKNAASRIKIEPQVTVSVHERDAVRVVRQHEEQMRERLTEWTDLNRAYYELRDSLSQANAGYGVSAALARKNMLDDHEKQLDTLLGSGVTSRMARIMSGGYSGYTAEGEGHEDDLHTLPDAVTAARKRLETVTSGDAQQRLTLPTFANKTLAEFRELKQTIGLQRAELLETIARINVTEHLNIEGETLETLKRHRLI